MFSSDFLMNTFQASCHTSLVSTVSKSTVADGVACVEGVLVKLFTRSFFNVSRLPSSSGRNPLTRTLSFSFVFFAISHCSSVCFVKVSSPEVTIENTSLI